MTDTDPWAAVVGQPELVSRLRRAVQRPSHAYLFVGLTGWGTRAAARAFAGDLLAGGDEPDEADRHRRLATAEHHPSMVVVERVGASISAKQADEVVRQASLTPAEGTRQVLVLVDFHLVRDAGPKLLKTIEEPPPGTFFIVLAEDVPTELVTIASRCVRFDFPPVSRVIVETTLVDEGADPERARAAAASSGGDLGRARLLVTDPHVVDRRRFWWEVPARLDGTGARAAELAAQAVERMDEVVAPLAAVHDAELASLEAEVQQLGLRRTALKEVEDRHKREKRRVRADELRSGLMSLMERYRDEATAGRPATMVPAAELVRQLEERLVFNPGEELALQSLFVALPRVGEA